MIGLRDPFAGVALRHRHPCIRMFSTLQRTGHLSQLTIRVRVKGGHERVIPLNPHSPKCCEPTYRLGGALATTPFFRSRFGRSLGRGSIYERVRTWGQRSRVGITLSPHRMRQTFATHLVRAGVGLVTIRDLSVIG